MAPSIPVTPIHASPAALADTSPMGAAAGWHSWTNMAEHAQLQILIPSRDVAKKRNRIAPVKIVRWTTKLSQIGTLLFSRNIVITKSFDPLILCAFVLRSQSSKCSVFLGRLSRARKRGDHIRSWFFAVIRREGWRGVFENRRVPDLEWSAVRGWIPASNSKSTSGGIGHGYCHAWR